MRTFDFAPFYRSTVGFDQLFSMLDQSAARKRGGAGLSSLQYQTFGQETYNISVAVAGFAGADFRSR